MKTAAHARLLDASALHRVQRPRVRNLRQFCASLLLPWLAGQALGADPVAAATPASAPKAAAEQLETVTVTAQKRTQNSQNVGIALSTLSGAEIERLGLSSPSQIPNQMTGVMLAQPNGTGAFSFSVRGVTQNDFADHQESPTAVYLDDVYISQMAGLAFMLFDTDRVEVLRGPQSTLFGRNATGGVAQFLTRRPTPELEGFAKLTAGSQGLFRSEAAVGGPLLASQLIQGRVAVSTNRHDPYFSNEQNPQGLENGNERAVRGQLLFKLPQDAQLLLIGRQGRQNVRAGAWESVTAQAGADGYGVFGGSQNALGYPASGNFHTNTDAAGYAKIDSHGLSARFDAPLPALGAKLTAIVDGQTLRKSYLEDSDTTPLPYFHFFNTSNVKQTSAELRLTSDSSEAQSTTSLKWIAGLYTLHIDGTYTEGAQGTLYGGLLDPYRLDTKSYAGFGQVELPLSESVSMIAGARYTQDNKSFDYVASYPGFNFAFGSATAGDLARLDDGFWSGKLEFDYKLTPQSMLYASYNRGVKAGGFNAPLDPGPTPDFASIPFKRETLNAYELGWKNELWEGKARINGALFYYDYKDNQALHFVNLTQLISNTPAKHLGAEIDVQLAPTSAWRLGVGASYLKATVKDIDLNGLGARDYRAANAPRWNAHAMARYSMPLAAGDLSAQLDGNVLSEQYFALTNAPDTRQGGYALANLRLNFVPGDGRYEFNLAVENLTNRHYAVMGFDLAGFLGLAQRYPGRMRNVAVSMSYNF